jgi:hypothetical protein
VLGVTTPSVHAENWIWTSAPRTILKIYPHDSGFVISVDGPSLAPNSACASANGLFIPLGSANYSAKIAALLTAYAQQKRINIDYDADSASCDVPINRFETEN